MQTIVPLADLADGTITKVMVGETGVVLVRAGDTVRAFAATCPHAGAPLEQGAVCNGRLVCPWHKATFRIEDGAVLEPPAMEGLTRYSVQVTQGNVIVSSDKMDAPAVARNRHGRIAAIIGSGAAGAAAAVALRHAGFEGRVLLIGDEALQPYDRTVLSKYVVAGEMPPQDTPPLLAGNDWGALDVERMDTNATGVDVATRKIQLADGSGIVYDAALLATGGVPKRPNMAGVLLPGVHTLRNLQDAAAILSACQPNANAVVVGSSFIGMEVASSLRKRGVGVTIVAPEQTPLARQFGEQIGAMFRKLHEGHGVAFRLGAEAAALEGDERVRQVVLKNGERLPADCVVLGIGVSPATDFVSGVELAEDGGILVDSAMRAAGTLFVAGDCASFPLHGRRVRIEHWRVAQQQGRVAALGMMGRSAQYEGVPFFWTEHYDKRFEYLGHADGCDELRVEGDLEAQDFIAYQIAGGRVVGVIACGRETATASLIERMRGGLTLSEALAVSARA